MNRQTDLFKKNRTVYTLYLSRKADRERYCEELPEPKWVGRSAHRECADFLVAYWLALGCSVLFETITPEGKRLVEKHVVRRRRAA